MARPTKYRADFPGRALKLMRAGASLCEVAADLGISEETIHVWKRDGKHKAFSEALASGVSLAQAWWERLGRAGAAGKVNVQPAVWIFTMKNRFEWTDKKEVTHIDDPLAAISDAELTEMINALKSQCAPAAPA